MSATVPPISPLEKRRFYSLPQVARSYDRQRFGGLGGARVNARELALVESLLPPDGRVLDLGCGTGRLCERITNRGYAVVGLDTSAEMLRLSRERSAALLVQADGFALPFVEAAFDAVVALRVAFHYDNLGALLSGACRVLAPGGLLVFDTCSWSPRAFAALGSRSWGGKVRIHRRDDVRRTAAGLGLEVTSENPCFLFSPYLYRLLPLQLARGLEWMERVGPSALLSRAFWQLRRAA